VEFRQIFRQLAKAINSTLFVPKLTTPIKTLDLPVAGRGYSGQTLPLIFELVNMANGIGAKDAAPVDVDGQGTVKFLKNTKRIVDRISGNHPSSLGLHPAVYFYSETGRYQPTAFLAFARFVQDLEKENLFGVSTLKRAEFEAFLLRHKTFSNQVTVKYGSGTKGFSHLRALFRRIFDLLIARRHLRRYYWNLSNLPNFPTYSLQKSAPSATLRILIWKPNSNFSARCFN